MTLIGALSLEELNTLFFFLAVGGRGGSRIFSRGGGADFQKIFQNFDDLFFLGRPN